MIVTVPELDLSYPSLGAAVCGFIESNLVFGPGDLRGQPARLDPEKRALIYRMYEVYPQTHKWAGRRRFRRCAVSLRKGSAKTELAAWIAACELHPEGPVRCVGWTEDGQPIGDGVTDPYIPLVAYTEEQSEDLAYGALLVILEQSPLRGDFDLGLERIKRKNGDGKAVALASAPDSRDGARTTFEHFDEVHRFTLPRLIRAHRTMLANLPKRQMADPWALETTTAFAPGEGSVAEATMEYAQAVQNGLIADPKLFFFHRQASDSHDLTTDEGVRAAVIEASGPIAEWSDIEGIVEQWKDPSKNNDRTYLERVWLNKPKQSASQAFDVDVWKALAKPREIAPGSLIALGFDGSRSNDATSVVATDILTGYQWLAGLWEKPANWPREKAWRVPEAEVDACVRRYFTEYDVWRMYADPPYWQEWIAKWVGEFGEERVIEWFTTRRVQMAAALENFSTAMSEGSLSHDGDPDLARHIANARRSDLPGHVDEQGRPLYLIRKERPDSPMKIDAAMAAVLSFEARTDAIAAGAMANAGPSVYEGRGLTAV